ncbi:unnamed protein product [Notodromas monacha]|uniref:Uncharacterized protein n=1 Tax=Notodromas monacha TaxID=399045 RepID=A0A7R9BVC8_9CRUS|nr:unnamed protein product [Notodromas monacha]CAG0921088.1 unnamed protein product [Notodromas monacha]
MNALYSILLFVLMLALVALTWKENPRHDCDPLSSILKNFKAACSGTKRCGKDPSEARPPCTLNQPPTASPPEIDVEEKKAGKSCILPDILTENDEEKLLCKLGDGDVDNRDSEKTTISGVPEGADQSLMREVAGIDSGKCELPTEDSAKCSAEVDSEGSGNQYVTSVRAGAHYAETLWRNIWDTISRTPKEELEK